ncbi:hypothetical protein A9K55_007268 [Cordyceps militaris]|uniref:Uncharacterized protein n=1 Tax=Cordyceps militaris TaxID=73501 RepID=A0A2H4SIF4_CORMI|nr:hypothetical protein A9K55_007268 [Cordyceps militaris]
MVHFKLHRAAHLLVCALCLLLGAVQATVAKETSKHNVLDDLSSIESLGQFPEVANVQLRRTYMALVSMFSDASREAAKRYGVSELRMLSNDLDSHVQTVNDNTNKSHRLELKRSTAPRSTGKDGEEQQSIVARFLSAIALANQDPDATEQQATNAPAFLGKRGLLDGLGKLLGGGKDGAADGAGGAISDAMSKAVGSVFDKLLSATGSGLAGAGFFGGVGVGEGASQALNLTTPQRSKSTGEQVAQQNGMTSSGLNPIIQSAAMGLTATALKAVVDSNLLKLPPLAGIAASLGTGVGNGATMGLGLTKRDVSPPLNGSGLTDSIGALGFGATQAITSNLNLTGGFASLLPAGGLDIGGLALGAGAGIGQGAARGLKLAKADAGPPPPKSNSDIPGIANTFAFGLSNALTESLNVSAQDLGAMLPPIDFMSAALSVGDGIGSGAALGLKLAQNDTSGFGTPSPSAAAPSMADLPKIAGTLAFGVSKSLTQSLNTSGLSVSNLLPADLDVGAVVLSAGRGLGGGASAGLGLAGLASNLTIRAAADPLTDVAGLVEKFTFGLGNAFTDKIDLASQANNLASALPSVDLGATVSGVGSGLGLGLAKGLNLGTKAVEAPPKPSSLKDVPQLAATFAFGLSDALIGQLNISGLTSELAKNAGGLVAKFAAPVASGLGKGLGTGAAVGLGLQPPSDPAVLKQAAPANGEIDAEALTQSFAEALTSKFLANNTAGELIKSLSGGAGTDGGAGSLLANVNVPRLANGLARGLLTGAGDGVQALGGINALISGKTIALAGPVPETKIDFDDSTNGAAIGLGQGLGTSGVLTVQKLLARGVNVNNVNATAANTPQRRDLAVLGRRQENTEVTAPLNLTQFASASAISTLGQKGIDVLTCDGIAGLFLVVLGLQKSGTVSIGSPSGNTLETLKSLIPMGIIRVESQGNTFAIDGTKLAENLGKSVLSLAATLSINGFPVLTYAAFLILHIGSAILGLYVIWPLILTFASFQNVAARFRIPIPVNKWTTKTSRILRLFVLTPSLILILIFGILSGAPKGHFRTAHGILGLFTLIFAIAALVLSFFAKPVEFTRSDPVTLASKPDIATWASHACNQILLALLLPTLVTGFADLSSVTLCVTRSVVSFEAAVSLGMGLVFVFALGQYMSSAELFLVFMAKRAAQKQRKALVEKAGEVPVSTQVERPVARRAGPVVFDKEEDREKGDFQEPRPVYI